MPYSPQKKLLKIKKIYDTPGKTTTPISQTSSERLKVTFQTYQMGNGEVKMKLGKLQQEIYLPASTYLSNDFKSFILETDQRTLSPFMRLLCQEQKKYLQTSRNNATYCPMNPDSDVTYQKVNVFSSDKCFISFISDVPPYI